MFTRHTQCELHIFEQNGIQPLACFWFALGQPLTEKMETDPKKCAHSEKILSIILV